MSRRHTLGVAALAVTTIAAVTATMAIQMPTKLIWNVTASAPIGLYVIAPADGLDVPDLVAVMPPELLATFMVGRGYVGDGVPLMKRVAGLPGQRVCRTGRVVTVDGVVMGDALNRDRIGRELPTWRGCRIIAPGELFLMNSGVRDSLDGRYFGPFRPAPSSVERSRSGPTRTATAGSSGARRPTERTRGLRTFPTTRRLTMPANIFEPTADGYAGRIRLFGIDEMIVLVAVEPSDADNVPAYRIHLNDEDGPEIGGAWNRVGERAGDYIALEIDSPIFPALFRPALFQADESRAFRLAWKRQRPREDRS